MKNWCQILSCRMNLEKNTNFSLALAFDTYKQNVYTSHNSFILIQNKANVNTQQNVVNTLLWHNR